MPVPGGRNRAFSVGTLYELPTNPHHLAGHKGFLERSTTVSYVAVQCLQSPDRVLQRELLL